MDTAKLDKIEALIRKATDPAATDAEAELFMAKAQELMAKYGIEDSMLRFATGERAKITNRYFALEGQYRDAQATLWSWCARANSCKVAWRHIGTHGRYGVTGLTVFGTEENLMAARTMFATSVMRMISKTMKQPNTSWDSTKAFRASFAQGWANSFGKRLVEVFKTATDDVPGAGLVLLDEAKRVDEAVDDAKRGQKFSNRETVFSRAGYTNGSDVGAKETIHRGTLAGSKVSLSR